MSETTLAQLCRSERRRNATEYGGTLRKIAEGDTSAKSAARAMELKRTLGLTDAEFAQHEAAVRSVARLERQLAGIDMPNLERDAAAAAAQLDALRPQYEAATLAAAQAEQAASTARQQLTALPEQIAAVKSMYGCAFGDGRRYDDPPEPAAPPVYHLVRANHPAAEVPPPGAVVFVIEGVRVSAGGGHLHANPEFTVAPDQAPEELARLHEEFLELLKISETPIDKWNAAGLREQQVSEVTARFEGTAPATPPAAEAPEPASTGTTMAAFQKAGDDYRQQRRNRPHEQRPGRARAVGPVGV